jgi:predicted NUDIX family phosphoesterase
VLRDKAGGYCLFRYPRKERTPPQLYSLVVGGHIDSGHNDDSLASLILETLKREILEEVGIIIEEELTPIGIAVDSSSLAASRHIGVVYEAEVDAEVKLQAANEFSVRSKDSGRFAGIDQLSRFRSKFDPWSSIIFSEYLEPRFKDVGRQATLQL